MTMRKTNPYRFTATAGIMLLAACQQNGPAAEGDSFDPPAANPTVSQSIIRPEVAPIVDEPQVPLRPLSAVIGFPEGRELDEVAQAALEEIFASPQLQGGGAITLRGHSDSDGSDAANLRAAQRRAEAVRDWLVEKGVMEERITIIALGEQNPVQPNALPDGTPNKAGRAANRRVEITVEPGLPASPLPQIDAPGEQTPAQPIDD